MTECNGCGACCHPFTIPVSPKMLSHFAARIDEGEWMNEHLTPIPRREGLALAPWSPGWTESIDDEGVQLTMAHYYRCDLYDPETRRCTDYEHRPYVCSRFPWSDGTPRHDAALPPTCSYNADIGKPVQPMPVEIRGRS